VSNPINFIMLYAYARRSKSRLILAPENLWILQKRFTAETKKSHTKAMTVAIQLFIMYIDLDQTFYLIKSTPLSS